MDQHTSVDNYARHDKYKTSYEHARETSEQNTQASKQASRPTKQAKQAKKASQNN
jgi:hypothetical protein